ncbi:hypothetical protein AB1L42_08725 [Thalassoglobus sp. JC818]|uniref:hypothetical protein n=1 Tax=Thalassoglobus sp. JC818 TaxID=3232136 RepID=UPI003458C1B1
MVPEEMERQESLLFENILRIVESREKSWNRIQIEEYHRKLIHLHSDRLRLLRAILATTRETPNPERDQCTYSAIAGAYLQISQSKAALAEYEDAIANCRKGLSYEPDRWELHEQLLELLTEHRSEEEVLEALEAMPPNLSTSREYRLGQLIASTINRLQEPKSLSKLKSEAVACLESKPHWVNIPQINESP